MLVSTVPACIEWLSCVGLCATLWTVAPPPPPCSSVHGIFQARILEWVAMPSRGSTWPRDQTSSLTSPALAGGFYTTSTTWEAPKSVSCSVMLVTLSGPILWDPMDYSPPGPSVHGILQPRILEWVTIPFSKTSTCIHTKSLQSSWTFCNQMDHSPPGLSVHGILQARKVEWVAMPSSRGSSWPGDRTLISMFPALSRKFFTTSAA